MFILCLTGVNSDREGLRKVSEKVVDVTVCEIDFAKHVSQLVGFDATDFGDVLDDDRVRDVVGTARAFDLEGLLGDVFLCEEVAEEFGGHLRGEGFDVVVHKNQNAGSRTGVQEKMCKC